VKQINKKGIYAMRFYINGEWSIVHIDDFFPVKKGYKNVYGEIKKGEWPAFADSADFGEIWPMVAEKAWAKLLGSYANTESGWNAWVLRYLTNDPVEVVKFNNMIPQSKEGSQVWRKLLQWSKREYLMFASTDDQSYVKYHTYTILEARELTINGYMRRILKLRNPWGKVKWKGAFAEGTKEYIDLEKQLKLRAEKEGGKFYMSYEDFVMNFVDVTMSYSQESRTGDAVEPEYRPRLSLRTTKGTSYMLITLSKDIDLSKDIFAISMWQGGNLLGTERNRKFKKFDTVYMSYELTPLDHENDFIRKWAGWGAHNNRWSWGDSGT